MVEHLLPLVDGKLVLLLRLPFLEGQRRKRCFSQFPPTDVLVSRARLSCPPGRDRASNQRDRWGALIQGRGEGRQDALRLVLLAAGVSRQAAGRLAVTKARAAHFAHPGKGSPAALVVYVAPQSISIGVLSY